MPANKRTKIERERDLVQIARLYLAKHSQQEIADAISADRNYTLTRKQIGYDLKEIRKQWRKSTIRDFDAARGEQLATIDEVERQHWQGWHRSYGQKTTSTRKTVTGGEDGGRDEDTVRQEDLAGDPRFLQGVMDCVKRRCELLGLDAPMKWAPTNPDGNKPYEPGEPPSSEGALARIMGILDTAAAARADKERNAG